MAKNIVQFLITNAISAWETKQILYSNQTIKSHTNCPMEVFSQALFSRFVEVESVKMPSLQWNDWEKTWNEISYTQNDEQFSWYHHAYQFKWFSTGLLAVQLSFTSGWKSDFFSRFFSLSLQVFIQYTKTWIKSHKGFDFTFNLQFSSIILQPWEFSGFCLNSCKFAVQTLQIWYLSRPFYQLSANLFNPFPCIYS